MRLLKERRTKEHPEPIATTWDLAFRAVEQQNPAAADLLRFCAFLAPDAIPEEILTAGAQHLGPLLAPVAADPFQLNDAIAALRAYSLLDRDPRTSTLTVHRLVQAVLLERLPTAEQQPWMQRAVQATNAAFPFIEFANWSTCERLLPHAQTCATWIEQTELATVAAARLLNQAGVYLYDRGRYAEAEPLYQRALAIRERELGASHPNTVTSLNNLAELYRVQGKYVEAEPLYQRALEIRERELGASHPNTATSLNNLALLYRGQGQYAEAEPLYQRALEICLRMLGEEHPTTQTIGKNYADLLRKMKEGG
jgi:tetratricopeptide (TPR) repeat protein